jgi:hypothetical protein
MGDHVLGIATLRTDVAVLARPQDAAPLRGRLDRVVSQRLPLLLAELAGPVLDGHDGVLRLRRLAVSIDHAGPFDEAVLTRLLATRLAAALRAALAAGPRADLRYWPDHGSYLVSYVETRLGIEPGPDWPFADLAPLALLSPAEATVALVRARPELLTALARAGARAGAPARLLTRLDDGECAALLDAAAPAAGPPSAEDLTRLVAADVADATATGPASPARRALALLLHTAVRTPPGTTPPVQAAMAVTALRETVSSRPGLRPADLAGDPVAGVVDLAADPALPAPFRAALRAALAAPGPRAALTGPTALASSSGSTAPRRKGSAVRPGVAASPVAGVALLLPGIARYGLHRALTAAQLRAAVISTLDEDAHPAAATDPVLAALLPADPQAEPGVPPAVPAAALAGLPPEVGGLLTGRAGPEGWGDLLLAGFAARLPALGAGSRGYLQRQFLHVPGRLELTEEVVTVTLEGPPLAVVLAMAGFDGAQAPLPHLGDRLLVLALTGLRR